MVTRELPSAERRTVIRDASQYRQREAALATKYNKQRALALPFRWGAGLSLRVPDALDTDLLGTFTGEIERTGTPGEVARRKVRLGMAAANLPLGLASEGTFGPHPLMPFVPSDFELLVFVDDIEGFSVTEEILTHETNYAREECAVSREAVAFAKRVGFPTHGVIVRPVGNADSGLIRKGIVTDEELARTFAAAVSGSPERRVAVETDMRAHMNPTRMWVLRRLGARLVRRLRTHCPRCNCPGFGRTGSEPGLPCSDCSEPTAMTLHEIHACPCCAERRHQPRADGQTSASPQHCPFCNP